MKRFFAMILFISLILVNFSLQAASPRMILVEEATNASCAPCASQNPAFKDWIYSNLDNVIPLIYHWYFPGRDVIHEANVDQNNRRIQTYYGINGVPSARVNGKMGTPTGGWYEGAPGDISALNSVFNQYKGKTSPLTINVTHTINGSKADVVVEIHSDEAISNKTLQVAAVEAYHYYENAGTNGEKEFYWVMRNMLSNEGQGETFSIGAGETKTMNYSYQLDGEWYPQVMYAVAFIQDDTNKEVLQAGSSPIQDIKTVKKLEVTIPQMTYFFKEDPNNVQNITLNVKNDNNFEIVANVVENSNSSFLPSDWSVDIITSEVTIPANGTAEITLDYNVGNVAAYSFLELNITPKEVETYISIPNKINIGMLSSNIENVFFYDYDRFFSISANAIMNNDTYGPSTAFIPLDPEALDAYPSEVFNMIAFLYSGTNSAFFSINDADKLLIDATLDYINNNLNNGGNVLVTADLALYYLANASYTPNSKTKQLLQTEMGITPNGQIYQYVQDNQLYSFELKGMADTPFSGLRLDGNKVYSSSFPVYQQYMDAMKLGANAKAIPLLYNSADATVFPMVGYENEAGGKIVYSSVNFGVIGANSADQTQRSALYNAVVEWFEGGGSTGGSAVLTTSVGDGTIIFDDTYIDEFNYYDLEITNTGDKQLTLNSAQLLNNTSNAFSVASGGSGFLLAPGESRNIKLMFNPKAEGNYTAILRLASDATNNEVDINIEAAAVINSVKDGVAGNESIFTMQVGPNPIISAGTLSYSINGAASRNVKIDLVNSKGSVVANIVNGIVTSGTHTIDLNSDDFTSGNYYLIGTADGYSTQLPVVIVK